MRVILKNILFIYVALFSILVVSVLAKGPDISFENPEFDFKTVQGGTVLKHIFKFKNIGDEELIIKDVKTSCGCTAVQTSEKPIKPGEWGQIKSEFNTAGYRGMNYKYIYVDTNVEHKPRITLSLKANIIYDIDIIPTTYIPFYSVKQGEQMSKSLTIRNNTDNPLKITEPVFENNSENSYQVKLETIKDGKEYKLNVTFQAGKKPGRKDGLIILKTNNPQKSEIKIDLSANVMAEVYVMPYSVIIQRSNPNIPRVKRLTIMNTSEKPLKILEVKSSSPYLLTSLEPIDKTPNYSLTVTLSKDAPKTRITGNIEIKTNNEKYAVLNVSCYITEERSSSTDENN